MPWVIVYLDGAYESNRGSGFPVHTLNEAAQFPTQQAAVIHSDSLNHVREIKEVNLHVELPTPHGDETRHLFATGEAAAAFIVRQPSKTRFFLSVQMDMPMFNEPELVCPVQGSGMIRISRADAKKLALNLLSSTMEGKGAGINITVFLSHDKGYACWIG